MELFNKIKSRLIISLLIFIIIGLSLYYILKADHHKKKLVASGFIEKLILTANSSMGSNPVFAKKTAEDALIRSINENQPDLIVQSWILLGKIECIKSNNGKALVLFTKAQQMAQQKHLFKDLCEAKIKIGEIIYDHGNYDSALTYFQDAERIANAYNFESVTSYTLYYIGKYHETKGNFEQAKGYYNRALEISRKNKDYRQLALILPSRGKNYLSVGKLNLALACYQEAFQLSEQLNDQLLLAESSSHLGSLYLQIGQYDKALEYDKKALAYRNNMHNPDGLAKSYNNIGKAFDKLKQQDSAFYYFNESLLVCENIDYKKGIVKALTNIARLYIDHNTYDKAFNLLTRAYNISSTCGYNIGMAESGLCLADMYKNLQQTNKAIYYYHLSLYRIRATNYDEMLKSVYSGLYECYSSINEYKLALQNHISLLEVEKRLLNVENKRQLALMDISFDVERKEKDNQVLRADNELKELTIKRKTTFIWLVIAVLGFTMIVCLYIYNRLYVNKKATRLLEELNQKITIQNNSLASLNIELENANREKDKLFSIISHELRNPLYWFQNLAEALSKKYKEMSPERIQKSLIALDESAKNAFHLMDNLLQWSRSKLNRIHPKKTILNLYELTSDTTEMFQTILQNKEIKFSNSILPGAMIFADADLFCCVIRNLISNAIKYTPNEGYITIECTCSDELVTIVISDSGTGINNNDINEIFDDNHISVPGLLQEKGSGLGLKLCKDFVELNGGQIWVKSIPDAGTKIFFTVPVFASITVGILKEDAVF